MSKKIEKLLSQADAYDVYPTVKLRPLLSPPRTTKDPADLPELYAMWCPNHLRVCVVEDSLTSFPTVLRCNGRPAVVELGSAVWIGSHLFKVEKRDKLLLVLQSMFGADVLEGATRRWIANAGIPSSWSPSTETAALFKSASAIGRGAPTPTMEPELIG